MSELPDEFPCTVTNWDYIYDLCRDVSEQVVADEFEPDMVVALARGGWFAGRCLCDFIGLDDLTSLKIEHYVGTAQTGDGPSIRYPMPEGSVEGKDVLIVDDIADTGGSLTRAEEHVKARNPGEIRSGTLQLLGNSSFEPDFVGERLEEWTWVVYPWNFIEDMVDLIEGVMERADNPPYTEGDVRQLLREYHDVDRFELEIAQPDRIDEVLGEMVRREVAEPVGENAWQLT